MPDNYATFEQAKSLTGIKLQVIKGIPSPWSEAAKAILNLKAIPYTPVAFDAFNPEQQAWFEANNAPSLKPENGPALSDWLDILNFAEAYYKNSFQEESSLLPGDNAEREEHLALCHTLCSKHGLGWQRRLQSVHLGLNEAGGFPIKIAQYLATKYGYHAEDVAVYESEIVRILGLLTARLKKQQSHQKHQSHQQKPLQKLASDNQETRESIYYFGENLTALDIYSAMFMAYFKPLSEEVCPMYPSIRTAFETYPETVAEGLDPILFKHRDYVFDAYLLSS
ncbi:hypothetical protein OA92_13060 [Marinomonas sp. SBI22]|uniref:glutathione S-transferase family protein n=1 Tax=unclassified Marinomonas TaxID=196814 RepID=UPI0007AF80B1|nr:MULTISPECIES: glutathione S-transferase family protein [unclassified Marinomonas]KZM42131.1 hypothetical protein OA92_13060 [Marinomonas sp. SBI22]KZM47025.1 hypothetical protein OA91_00345 [Marinomonas sp. SBI8L]